MMVEFVIALNKAHQVVAYAQRVNEKQGVHCHLESEKCRKLIMAFLDGPVILQIWWVENQAELLESIKVDHVDDEKKDADEEVGPDFCLVNFYLMLAVVYSQLEEGCHNGDNDDKDLSCWKYV